jgi:hypothetical protein
MSDKDRQKKDGQDKNKKNQRRRAGESNAAIKKNTSTAMDNTQRWTDSGTVSDRDQPPRRPAPADARTHASKAMKGK